MIHYDKTLYKLSKQGKVLEFRILVEETIINRPALITSKGFIDGAHQQDKKPFLEGKNLGRANETTPLQQATSEAESKVNKLLDKGYKYLDPRLMPDDTSFLESNLRNWLRAQGDGTDASGRLKPMLAQKNTNKVQFPSWVQRKYDGIRCFTFVDLDSMEVTKVSRNGKPFEHISHLDPWILKVLKRFEEIYGYGSDYILDGELYSHTLNFQTIVSAVKREQKINEEIEYRIYDVIPQNNLQTEQGGRLMMLQNLRDLIRDEFAEAPLEFVKTWEVKNWDEARKKFEMFIGQGYEGAMFRMPGWAYEFGKRSYGLIKYKEFDEEEFQIKGIEEATGRDEGTAIMVMWDEKNQIEFRARPMGTWEERENYYINMDKYIGKMGTVKFQGRSQDKIPRFPVFKIVRDYE